MVRVKNVHCRKFDTRKRYKERFKECSGVRKCIYIRNDSKSRNSRTWYQNIRHAKGMEETNAKDMPKTDSKATYICRRPVGV